MQTLSYSDVLDHLSDWFGASLTDAANQRKLRGAVQTAYSRLALEKKWVYLTGVWRIALVASYKTGTIQFDKSTNQVTLTGGTLPAWAARGTLRSGNVTADVATRDSDTQLTLDADRTFVADLPAGSSFVLYQNSYPLPDDFVSMCRPVSQSHLWIGDYITPEEFNALQRFSLTQGPPRRWTVTGDRKDTSRKALLVFPAPQADQPYDFVYYRSARPLVKTGKLAAETAGTVTATNGTNTLTGAGTNWDSSMVGSVIRLSGNAKLPDGVNGLNPYLEQVKITAVGGATSMTVETNLARSYAGAGFVVTDLVDMAPMMFEAIFRCAEWQASIVFERGNIDAARARYRTAAIQAMEADRVLASTEQAGEGSQATMGGINYMPVIYPDGTTWP